MTPPKYQIGEEVFVPRFQPREVAITCPDCLGQKALTVIMGDGEQVSIDCSGCAPGYNAPNGYLIIHEWTPLVEWGRIEGVELTDGKYQYRGTSFYGVEEDRITKTKEEAQAVAEQLAVAHKAEELSRFQRCKENNQRSWAWNAHYHRKQIKYAQSQLEYHTAKLNVAKVKAKEGEPVTA